MYLIDTNVISENRKGRRSNAGVRRFFKTLDEPVYLSSITIGELQRGVTLCRYRGDLTQADMLTTWLTALVSDFSDHILPFCHNCAQVWGHLCAPDNTNVIDKQLAATALVYDLTLATRNVRHVADTGVRVFNPFE